MLNNINNHFKEQLEAIFSLLDKRKAEEACQLYLHLIEEIEHLDSKEDLDTTLAANIYYSFAELLITLSEIESGINMLIQAQAYGVLDEEIDQLLMTVFISPNLKEYKRNFTQNMHFFDIDQKPQFEHLDYFPIPTTDEHSFYFYNKKTRVLSQKHKLFDSTNAYYTEYSDSYSGYTIAFDWNVFEINKQVNNFLTQSHSAVFIVENLSLFLSSLQAHTLDLEQTSHLIKVLPSDKAYTEYFETCNDHLHRNIFAKEASLNHYKEIIHDLHLYRITDQGRHGDNVILSICIPTYNRGQRALKNVLHTLNTHFDEEIELIISDNGTENETRDYYDQIAHHRDPRVTYYRHDRNMGISLNVCQVCKMAKGQFLILLSDEDHLHLEHIETILSHCKKHGNSLASIRSSHVKQGKIQTVGLFQKGKDAILNYMMTSNYIYGIIFNKPLIDQSGVIDYIINNQENNACYYYPHMVIELFLAQLGNILGVDTVFIQEGEAEKTEFSTTSIDNTPSSMPIYSTVENRIKQLHGFYKITKDLDISKNDFEIQEKMAHEIISKTVYLTYLSCYYYYKKENANIFQLFYDVYSEGSKVLEDLYDTQNLSKLEGYQKQLGNMIHQHLKML